MANDYSGMAGIKVTGFTKRKMPDPSADAERVPACILVDTSGSMSGWSALLKDASVQMIEAIAKDATAREKVDIEVIAFNTEEQVCVKITAQEVYNLIDEVTGKIKPEFEQSLQFNCSGGTPTAYALEVAVKDLRDRYEQLKASGKAPKSPLLFVLSDGLPEVRNDMKAEHDKLLEEQLARIKQLVGENRLSVVAVKIGRICEEPQDEWDEKNFPKMHKLMQDITGLNNDHHVRIAKNAGAIADFFKFTSTLIKESAGGKLKNPNNMDLRNEHSEL